MDSLVDVLRRIPLFASLPRGSFAKIIADLIEEHHPVGAVLCFEGEPARDFFIVREGSAAVLINRDRGHRELVATIDPGDWFGERALFAEFPRSATVVATVPMAVWRLSKEKFDALLEENPWVIRHLTQVLSERLYQANRELSAWQHKWAEHVRQWLADQAPTVREYALYLALLPAVTNEALKVVAAVTKRQGADDLSEPNWARFLRQITNRQVPQAATRELLLREARRQWGDEELARRRRTLAAKAEEMEQWDLAAVLYEQGGEPGESDRLRARSGGDSEALVAGISSLSVGVSGRTSGSVLIQDRWQNTRRLQSLAPEENAPNREPRTAFLWSHPWLSAVAAVVIAGGGWFLPVPAGLSPEAIKMLAVLAAAGLLWITEALPDYVVALAMILAWVLFRIVPRMLPSRGSRKTPSFSSLGCSEWGAPYWGARSGGLLAGLGAVVSPPPTSVAALSVKPTRPMRRTNSKWHSHDAGFAGCDIGRRHR